MADFSDILKKINDSISNMNKRIPSIQKDIYDGLQEDLRKLDLQDGKIKATVKNLSLINSIKNKLNNKGTNCLFMAEKVNGFILL